MQPIIRDITEKDLQRTCEINKEKLKAFKDKGYSAARLIKLKKFSKVFIDRYFDVV